MMAADFVVSVPTYQEKHPVGRGYGAGRIIYFGQRKQNRGRNHKCRLERFLPKGLEYEFGAEGDHTHLVFHGRLITLPQRRLFEATVRVEESQPFSRSVSDSYIQSVALPGPPRSKFPYCDDLEISFVLGQVGSHGCREVVGPVVDQNKFIARIILFQYGPHTFLDRCLFIVCRNYHGNKRKIFRRISVTPRPDARDP